MAFVQAVPGKGEAIATAILAMARAFGLTVLAEGVETAAQLNFFRNTGCQQLQGYFFGRALPAGAFAALWLDPRAGQCDRGATVDHPRPGGGAGLESLHGGLGKAPRPMPAPAGPGHSRGRLTAPLRAQGLWYKTSANIGFGQGFVSVAPASTSTRREQALSLLQRRGMMRLREFGQAGVTATTISRLEREGAIVRLARGLYQLADADLDQQHTLAEVAKLIPKGVVCLTSALAFHGLTDQLPARVWVALDRKDWRPRIAYPPVRIVRFPPGQLSTGVEQHLIEDVPVSIFGVAKTIADLFRYRRTVGQAVMIDALRETLRQRKATPADIARFAGQAGVWKAMQPYLTTLTSDG